MARFRQFVYVLLKTETFEHPHFRLCWFELLLNYSVGKLDFSRLCPLHCPSKLQANLHALAFATQLVIATLTDI